VGYTGGHENNPSYNAVCANHTGHVEAVRVIYDIKKLDYTKVARYFFEIHNPTQTNGQGPDIGSQYLSKIFYYNDAQKTIATSLIEQLNSQGNLIATTLHPVTIFWPAEDDHQDYCRKNKL
jgi:peptide methionine sulfoxide reductase msrA/msrB